MLLLWVTTAILAPLAVDARSVFAHFMVSNVAQFNVSDWTTNINYAKQAGIDAFALNIAAGEATTDSQVPFAFEAAELAHFQLFFSFDYAGNGAWDGTAVSKLISKYATSAAYFYRGSQPLVSTFEGPDSAADWVKIKSDTGCFFIPDWSSRGAKEAMTLAGGVVDGLFSWAAWPTGPADMDTYTDASYYNYLGGKPYMMPISPWFYTNMPGFTKNWLWRGDSLWFDRWQQLIALDHQPEFVQIISWNDFGESHYIGPLDDHQYEAFGRGKVPYNYVEGMPHDGWRDLLPFVTQLWKTGSASVQSEVLVGWYRLHPATGCSDGGTTGNTASQLQLEYPPAQIIQDKIFFAAILTSDAAVAVTVGGQAVAAQWTAKPYGGAGMYGGSASTNGATGEVRITVSGVATVVGQAISSGCAGGTYNNYNAWVVSSADSSIARRKRAAPLVSTANLNCTEGFGVFNFAGLCKFTCENGYCPSSVCVCTALGVANPPPITKTPGFPIAGMTPSYKGLCDFSCNHGYCPDTACGYTEQPLTIPTHSEFLPFVPINGSGPSPFEGLCSYSCNYGMCPMHICKTLQTGPLIDSPAKDASVKASAIAGVIDEGLCTFSCQRGYCPSPCTSTTPAQSTSPSDPDPTAIYDAEPACSTSSVGVWSAAPTPDAGSQPVEGTSYFSILRDCGGDTSIVDHNEGYRTKADFFKVAYKDAVMLADQALDWPLYGQDASDLYFGPGTEKAQYSDDIHANLAVAADWDHGRWGLDHYIMLGCAQDVNGKDIGYGKCDAKIGKDPRPIGCYVNNTRRGVFNWNYSYIWCCNSFFQSQSVATKWAQYKGKDPDNLDLRYLQTSGGLLLHEMMHSLEITGLKGERKHIKDQVFDGSTGRRVYGAVDVAKAARIYGPSLTSLNADSYNQFASAHYWQKRFGGKVPQPKLDTWVGTLNETIGDSDNNYSPDNCLSAPADFNCNCGENGCSEDSAPCCANGSCQCHCDEDGCAPSDPACCASGTCNI